MKQVHVINSLRTEAQRRKYPAQFIQLKCEAFVSEHMQYRCTTLVFNNYTKAAQTAGERSCKTCRLNGRFFFSLPPKREKNPQKGFQWQPEEMRFLKWLFFLWYGKLNGEQKGQIGEPNQIECVLVQAGDGGVWLRVIVVLVLKNMNDFQRDLESELDNVSVHRI